MWKVYQNKQKYTTNYHFVLAFHLKSATYLSTVSTQWYHMVDNTGILTKHKLTRSSNSQCQIEGTNFLLRTPELLWCLLLSARQNLFQCSAFSLTKHTYMKCRHHIHTLLEKILLAANVSNGDSAPHVQ